MEFDGAFRSLGALEVSELVARVESVTEPEWAADTWRQTQFPAHTHTQVLPLLYDEDFRHEDPTRRPDYDRFEPALGEVTDAIAAALGEGYFLRVILARLAPKAKIPPHRDGGDSLPFVHRVHLPVITSERVRFTVDSEHRHLGVGELWEINNLRLHAVDNAGETHRVHLIVDYVTPALLRRRELAMIARELLA